VTTAVTVLNVAVIIGLCVVIAYMAVAIVPEMWGDLTDWWRNRRHRREVRRWWRQRERP
jgi:hypothetical protein